MKIRNLISLIKDDELEPMTPKKEDRYNLIYHTAVLSNKMLDAHNKENTAEFKLSILEYKKMYKMPLCDVISNVNIIRNYRGQEMCNHSIYKHVHRTQKDNRTEFLRLLI